MQMIVPPIFEIELTGHLIGFECQHRGKTYACHIWRVGQQVRCSKDGAPTTWEKLPTKLRRSVHAWVAWQKKLAPYRDCCQPA
jgi:hypothetical protein